MAKKFICQANITSVNINRVTYILNVLKVLLFSTKFTTYDTTCFHFTIIIISILAALLLLKVIQIQMQLIHFNATYIINVYICATKK